jgi:hypothetical protein
MTAWYHMDMPTSLASNEPPRGVVDLPRAGIPADHGLASLGLVMQLAARTSGALAALGASIVVIENPRRHLGWFLFAVALCFARSQLHRLAGRDLVYSRRTDDDELADPFDATRTYIGFGVGHAVVIGLIANLELGATTRTAAGIATALALWPLVLGAVLRQPRFRALRAGIPLGEDRGLEGASIVMTVLGACGALSAGAIVLALGGLPSRHLQHGWGVMLVVVFVLLLVRSCLHIRVGLAGLREASFDRPGELAGHYASFGVISAFCVGGVLALLAVSERLAPEALACVVVICSLLTAWPMLVKRYVSHRQFAELLAGDRVIHRRAPDTGLTGLGWLLAGHAVLVAALLILELTVQQRGIGRPLDDLLQLALPLGGRSAIDLGLGALIVMLELCAAAALVRMSDHRRTIATTYALIGGVVALALAWPATRMVGRHFNLPMVIRWVPAAIQIVIPAVTLGVVHRAVAPIARARYRS